MIVLWKKSITGQHRFEPQKSLSPHSLNTIYSGGGRLFFFIMLIFICKKKCGMFGWFAGRRALRRRQQNKQQFPHTKYGLWCALWSESLHVSKHFVEQFKPGKVVPSFILLRCGCSAVKPDAWWEREIVTASRPAWWERERNCQAKLGRLFQIGTTPPPPPPPLPLHHHPHTKAQKEWGIFNCNNCFLKIWISSS